MAITDALGTAAKMIGVAADVYMGKVDTKYQQPPAEPKQEDTRPWLTQKQFEQAEARIMNGDADVLDKLKAAFRIKKEYSDNLIKAHEHFNSGTN